MDEDEAALLAELRAISEKSYASNRFASTDNNNSDNNNDSSNEADCRGATDNNDDNNSNHNLTKDDKPIKTTINTEENNNSNNTTTAQSSSSSPRRSPSRLPSPSSRRNFLRRSITPPWRRGGATARNQSSPSPPSSRNKIPTTSNNNDKSNEIAAKLSPLKQSSKREINDEGGVVIMAPSSQPPPEPKFQSSDNDGPKNTFKGERGGAAEDPELLALLRGISTGASSRFDDDNNNTDNANEHLEENNDTTETTKQQLRPPSSPNIPPWKRKQQQLQKNGNKNKQNEIDVIVSAPSPKQVAVTIKEQKQPSPKPQYGIKKVDDNIPKSTFQGERGGPAEDAELLALLRGVSANAGANSRFDDNSSNNNDNAEEEKEEVVVMQKEQQQPEQHPDDMMRKMGDKEQKSQSLPPWKRKGRKENASNNASNVDVEIVVASPTKKRHDGNDGAPSTIDEEPKYGIKSDLPNTFQGERGGVADDPELLALLRGVSSNAAATSRFDDDNTNDNDDGTNQETLTESRNDNPTSSAVSKAESSSKESGLPPWKRRGKKKDNSNSTTNNIDVEVLVAAPPSPAKTDAKEPVVEPKYGIKSDLPNTFQGERGGSAEDPELLALLRGVSSNAASTSRFDNNNDDDTANADDEESVAMTQNVATDSVESKKAESSSKERFLPPWKRRGKKKENSNSADNVDVVVTAASSSPPSSKDDDKPKAEPKDGIKSDLPNTFQGDRGGSANDPELLALLRGVSSNAASTSRFDSNDNDQSSNNGSQDENRATSDNSESDTVSNVSSKSKSRSRRNLPLPPWKRKGKTKNNSDTEDDAPSATRKEPSYGIKSDLPNTFKGDRGGAAEDAELLALLRGVSAKSGASRFDDSDNDNTNNDDSSSQQDNDTKENQIDPKVTRSRKKLPLPPWKRKGKKEQQKETITTPVSAVDNEVVSSDQLTAHENGNSTQQTNSDVIIEEPTTLSLAPSDETSASRLTPPAIQQKPTYGIKSDLPNTFQGERGGTAEDAELLALLRGVSAKSAASRFDDEDNTNDDDAVYNDTGGVTKVEEKESGHDIVITTKTSRPSNREKASSVQKNNESLPPWKRKSKSNVQTNNVDVSAISPSSRNNLPSNNDTTTESAVPEEPSYGIKSDLPSTFKGERGGAAEDPELLALLRGVSTKSSSQQRFNDSEDNNIAKESTNSETVITSEPKRGRNGNSVPPWKKNPPKTKKQVEKEISESVGESTENDAVIVPRYGIKSDLPSTFKGERGGAAEDAELLALLRGVSNNAGASRFDDDVDNQLPPKDLLQPMERKPVDLPKAPAQPISLVPQMSSSPSNQENELEITPEEVPTSLTDKNWKVRKQAYVILKSILQDVVSSSNSDIVDSDLILAGLDNRIPSFMEEANAVALDKALDFAILYAEHCSGAGDAEQAARIVSSMLKKNAFSSRPTTAKLASDLVLKLMEVSWEGASSVHSIVEVLLREGLSSKKPKIIQSSVNLILDAAIQFGAATLPLALIKSSAAKMLSHQNPKVRECAVQILAEICRTLGSKDPLQDVINNMKSTQTSELDSLLAKQPKPTPIETGLRSSKGSGSASPEEALAALHAEAKEMELKRFASRPAVDVVSAVAKTDYASLIQEKKWSQKVAALKLILECGGEKPYKLAQPSSSVSYVVMISEMKKLLSHTHFAVVCKAMEVLSMLAEGVGEKLYPNLRPLLVTLIQLSKDKKLTKAVSSCLDCFFGNVLSFDNVLDKDDALPFAVNEKHEKNALARTTALDFLCRCIERRDEAGHRAVLCSRNAASVSSLCIEKLSDSDATVRKAALNTLMMLQKVDDSEILSVVNSAIDSLKSSNPRAYKTLSKVTTESQNPNDSAVTREQKTNVEKSSPSQKSKSCKIESTKVTKISAASSTAHVSQNDARYSDAIPSFEDAVAHVSNLSIPQWDDSEDDGGIFEGLKASKWQLRHDAIKSLVSFVESGHLDNASSDIDLSTTSILVLVREQTRGFQETNVNIMKAIIELFNSFCELYESKERLLMRWAASEAVSICVQKISDRKLCASCKTLLTATCIVCSPSVILHDLFEGVKSVKSPIGHEETLNWFFTFLIDFGAGAVGSEISDIIPHLITESESTNVKVRRQAFSCMGEIHHQVGPAFRALATSLAKKPMSKEEMNKVFDDNPFELSAQTSEREKTSLAKFLSTSKGPSADNSQEGITLDVPKTDFFSTVSTDLLKKLGSKDGKASWKQRKEALDEVESSLNNASGLLDTSQPHMKRFVELTRSLRDRLSDTQINLRPLAARVIGSLHAHVDKAAQAKLGKIVFAALINAAMNDIKKPVRDASVEALRNGTTLTPLDGGGANQASLEVFIGALVDEVNEAAVRAAGLPDVLQVLLDVVDSLPNLDEIVVARGLHLGEKYASMVVDCLTSSKSETRSIAEKLLEGSIENNIIGMESIRKVAGQMKPAKQRSIGPTIAKMSKLAPERSASFGSSSTSNYSSQREQRAVVGKGKAIVKETNAISSRIPKYSSSRAKGLQNVEKTEKKLSLETKQPLFFRSGKLPGSTKSIIWPEFPEEPHGNILGNLKRFWSPFLLPKVSALLFPPTSIRKQDDAKDGCDIIKQAIAYDRDNATKVVEQQLDLILKWLVFALCSKETTTGLQEVLSTFKDLFTFLLEIGHELTDSEVHESIPFILEKSSNAKGRFRDSYAELHGFIQSEKLIPPKRLGSVVCAAVIDSSTHAKARANACEICLDCVEKCGLPGIGKKGIVSSAKMLSQETAKHRGPALELLSVTLSRMNGDVQRLVRICGPNLSNKGRQLLEEHWNQGRARNSGPSLQRAETPSRRSQVDSPRKNSGSKNLVTKSEIYSELPKLSLRSNNNRDLGRPSPKEVNGSSRAKEDPFSFSLSSLKSSSPPIASLSDAASEGAEDANRSAVSELSGTAASLRARLMKIREKSKIPDNFQSIGSLDEEAEENGGESLNSVEIASIMDLIENFLYKSGPIHDTDDDLERCLSYVKVFHAAFSRQQHSTGLSSSEIERLRGEIFENMDESVGLLRRLITFSLHSGQSDVNAGMLLPLLSLCLAALMALFRDSELAGSISLDELTQLVRETGTALLDPRLSSSDGLTEEVGSQMVRAINKLAVQAATGADRHVSFQALLKLQQQLVSESASTEDREFINRLSRVVTKLFARVLRAEEAMKSPYSCPRIDMPSLISYLNDALITSGDIDANESNACFDMVKSLILSILGIHGTSRSLHELLIELDIDPETSSLASLLRACSNELRLSDDDKEGHHFPSEEVADMSASEKKYADSSETKISQHQPTTPSKDVALLVSQLGSSSTDEEKETALSAIRRYKKEHGDEELNAHLQQLSGAFREFIEAELSEHSSRLSTQDKATAECSVSERIRNLRSRLRATELTIQPEDSDMLSPTPASTPPRQTPALPKPVSPSDVPSTKIPARVNLPSPSRLAHPSPSKLVQPMPTKAPTLSTAQSLRERLAARKTGDAGHRSDTTSAISNSSGLSSSLGRAAALRARLEAVKQQSKQS